jgi:hypothetical protein
MITILFTCHGCKLEKQKVSVRERTKDEDVIQWMDATMLVVKDAHSILSPHCRERKVDLMIPVDTNAMRVGAKP